MPEVAIRPSLKTDYPLLRGIEGFYQTSRVWQMERLFDEGQFSIFFREVRLPRPVKVDYPRSHDAIFDEKQLEDTVVLVASLANIPVGFVRIAATMSPRTAWVHDLIVREDTRSRGVGTALVVGAQEWALERGYRRMTIEMQSKNYPAISLVRKMGYELSGYNDQYYMNQDIAVFFTRWLR